MMRRLHGLSVVAAILIIVLVALGTPLRAGPPGQVNFQARLTDTSGKVLPDGPVSKVTFKLYSDAALTQFLWGEIHRNVLLNRGVVSVQLGAGNQAVSASGQVTEGANPLTASVFNDGTKYLQIAVNDDAPLTPAIPIVSVPYSLNAASLNGRLDSQLVPIGTIVDWYRPTTGTPVPDGWRICDGSTVVDAASPFHTRAVPNLVGRVTRGLDPSAVTASAYGASATTPFPDQGGHDAISLAHSHNLGSHTHSISSTGDHNHGLANHRHSISTEAAHTHTGTTGAQQDTTTFNQVDGGGFYNTSNHIHQFTTDAGGSHNHTGFTGTATGNTDGGGSHNHGGSTGAASGTSDPALVGDVDIRPTYVGLLKIIRIK